MALPVALWLDPTYIKLRRSGRIVSVAAIGTVNLDSRREVLGIAVQPSEAEVFRDEFLRSLANRGLRGTRLIIADDHKGPKAAAAKVLGATVQRCRVRFIRNALACVGKKDRPIVTAALRTAFDQDTLAATKEPWAKLTDVFEPRHPRLAELMRRAEEDVLARARAQFGTHPGSSRCDGHRLIMHFCNLFLGLFWDLSG